MQLSKYQPLKLFLSNQLSDDITLEYGELEDILGVQLPPAAHKHAAWWSNDPLHVQAVAWLEAGWRMHKSSRRHQWVRFIRD